MTDPVRITPAMRDAYRQAAQQVWRRRAPFTQGAAVDVDNEATDAGLAAVAELIAAEVLAGHRTPNGCEECAACVREDRAEVAEEIAAAIDRAKVGVAAASPIRHAYEHCATLARDLRVPHCGHEFHGADGGRCPGCGFDPYRLEEVPDAT